MLANIRYTGYIKISTFIMERVEWILCVLDVNRESVSTRALSAEDHTPEIITCQVNLCWFCNIRYTGYEASIVAQNEFFLFQERPTVKREPSPPLSPPVPLAFGDDEWCEEWEGDVPAVVGEGEGVTEVKEEEEGEPMEVEEKPIV